MSLEILEPGLCSLIVDAGRLRGRRYGVHVGGAADQTAFALGNALIGNSSTLPALEIALAGPTLRAHVDAAAVVFGAPFDVVLDGQGIRPGVTFTWPSGAKLAIGGAPRGARAYLCVGGGFRPRRILNSCSSIAPCQRGDVLDCGSSRIHSRRLPEGIFESLGDSPVVLRCVPGGQAGRFDWSQFLHQDFRIGKASDRMGLRLEGKPLAGAEKEIASEPVCPGTVQVTSSGQCILLGVDGQTIGGYPKIAHVIWADMPRVGQLRPGGAVRFERIDMAKAEELNRQARAWLAEWTLRLRVGETFSFNLGKNQVGK